MKSIITILAFLFISLTSFAQHTHKTEAKSEWKELETFHGVIGQTFHPSEEGNLEPIKKRSGEMVEKAKKLAASTPPATYNTKSIKEAVKELVAESVEMDKAVKRKDTDKQLTTQLHKVHETFHKVQGLCSKEG